jgi:hypothetical protein
VDLRGRDASGNVTGASGGYRVLWFNPTQDLSGNVVAPDFWVVSLGTTHFVLPASFPSAAQATTDAILTDARTYLPSGSATKQAGDTVAPGYCWFDVPLELRPAVGSTTTLTVFGVKSILKNNPPAGARSLVRTDWIDGIKTATANISVLPAESTSVDLSYAYKIPFNFPWDVVVANTPLVSVGN